MNVLLRHATTECERINVIKEDNSLLDDFDLIDNCLNKNIFMKNMNRAARLFFYNSEKKL